MGIDFDGARRAALFLLGEAVENKDLAPEARIKAAELLLHFTGSEACVSPRTVATEEEVGCSFPGLNEYVRNPRWWRDDD